MRTILACAALVSTALSAAGCGQAGPMAPTHTDVESRVYSEPMTRIVFTGLASSDLTVRASSGPAATLSRELHWRGAQRPELTETWEGQTLRVSYRCLTPNCSVDYEVSLPATVEVHAETTSGDIDVHGMSGPVVIETTSGDIALSGVGGDITAQATSGNVESTDLGSGRVTVKASSGDIGLDFTTAPELVSVRATSGDTSITVPSGRPYAVHVRTTSGDQRVAVDQSQSATGKIDVESTSGDVTIGYGPGRSGGSPSPTR
jgi:hypothetical protein